MAKIKIKVTLNTSDLNKSQEYSAIFQPKDQIIIYQEEDKTITKIYLKEPKLRRENDKLWMELVFSESKITDAKVKVKDLNKILMLQLKTLKVIKNKENIEINYQLENEKYKYKLEVL